MVNEEQIDEFVALFQLAHFYSWAFFHERFGINDMPWARMFFSDISVRHCMCKEANESMVTISNPIDEAMGESLTIKDIKNRNGFTKLLK